MRLLVLSPQDSSRACLGAQVTGSTRQQALGNATSVPSTGRLQDSCPPQKCLGTPSGTPRHIYKHGQVPETQEHLLSTY